MILALIIVTASFRPAAPTVGDPITIVFEQPVVLDRSEAYELMSQQGKQVVVRTFKPEPFALSGRVGNVFFRKLIVPVGSVLRPGEDLKPAPLDPPLPPPPSRRPYVAIAIASGIAAAVWLAVLLLARRARFAAMPVPEVPAEDRFRRTVEQLRSDPAAPHRWAALADATRRYLAATDPSLGLELTTSEILRHAGEDERSLARILRQGDMEKFSPWGAQPGDFDAVAESALGLIPQAPLEVAA